MILERGTQVLVVHRRLFEADRARYFLGKVEDYEAMVARVTGFTWIQDTFNGKMIKKEGTRTKIFSIASGTLIIYALPGFVHTESVRLDFDDEGRLFLSDDTGYRLDLSEGIHKPRSTPSR